MRRLRIRNVTVGDAGASQTDLDGAIAQLVIQRDGDGEPEVEAAFLAIEYLGVGDVAGHAG